MNNFPRVLLVDGFGISRVGLATLVQRWDPAASIEEAGTSEEALTARTRGPWNLVVIDPAFETGDGVDVVRQIRASNPGSPILVFSAGSELQIGLAAMLAGANGFLSKRATAGEIEAVIARLVSGGNHASSILRERVSESRSPFARAGGFASLSEAERRVLRDLGRGQTVKQIASARGVGVSTISTYRRRILMKLKLSTTAELVRYVIEHKLHAA